MKNRARRFVVWFLIPCLVYEPASGLPHKTEVSIRSAPSSALVFEEQALIFPVTWVAHQIGSLSPARKWGATVALGVVAVGTGLRLRHGGIAALMMYFQQGWAQLADPRVQVVALMSVLGSALLVMSYNDERRRMKHQREKRIRFKRRSPGEDQRPPEGIFLKAIQIINSSTESFFDVTKAGNQSKYYNVDQLRRLLNEAQEQFSKASNHLREHPDPRSLSYRLVESSVRIARVAGVLAQITRSPKDLMDAERCLAETLPLRQEWHEDRRLAESRAYNDAEYIHAEVTQGMTYLALGELGKAEKAREEGLGRLNDAEKQFAGLSKDLAIVRGKVRKVLSFNVAMANKAIEMHNSLLAARVLEESYVLIKTYLPEVLDLDREGNSLSRASFKLLITTDTDQWDQEGQEWPKKAKRFHITYAPAIGEKEVAAFRSLLAQAIPKFAMEDRVVERIWHMTQALGMTERSVQEVLDGLAPNPPQYDDLLSRLDARLNLLSDNESVRSVFGHLWVADSPEYALLYLARFGEKDPATRLCFEASKRMHDAQRLLDDADGLQREGKVQEVHDMRERAEQHFKMAEERLKQALGIPGDDSQALLTFQLLADLYQQWGGSREDPRQHEMYRKGIEMVERYIDHLYQSQERLVDALGIKEHMARVLVTLSDLYGRLGDRENAITVLSDDGGDSLKENLEGVPYARATLVRLLSHDHPARALKHLARTLDANELKAGIFLVFGLAVLWIGRWWLGHDAEGVRHVGSVLSLGVDVLSTGVAARWQEFARAALGGDGRLWGLFGSTLLFGLAGVSGSKKREGGKEGRATKKLIGLVQLITQSSITRMPPRSIIVTFCELVIENNKILTTFASVMKLPVAEAIDSLRDFQGAAPGSKLRLGQQTYFHAVAEVIRAIIKHKTSEPDFLERNDDPITGVRGQQGFVEFFFCLILLAAIGVGGWLADGGAAAIVTHFQQGWGLLAEPRVRHFAMGIVLMNLPFFGTALGPFKGRDRKRKNAALVLSVIGIGVFALLTGRRSARRASRRKELIDQAADRLIEFLDRCESELQPLIAKYLDVPPKGQRDKLFYPTPKKEMGGEFITSEEMIRSVERAFTGIRIWLLLQHQTMPPKKQELHQEELGDILDLLTLQAWEFELDVKEAIRNALGRKRPSSLLQSA